MAVHWKPTKGKAKIVVLEKQPHGGRLPDVATSPRGLRRSAKSGFRIAA
jgi:hypothetical protein